MNQKLSFMKYFINRSINKISLAILILAFCLCLTNGCGNSASSNGSANKAMASPTPFIGDDLKTVFPEQIIVDGKTYAKGGNCGAQLGNVAELSNLFNGKLYSYDTSMCDYSIDGKDTNTIIVGQFKTSAEAEEVEKYESGFYLEKGYGAWTRANLLFISLKPSFKNKF